MEILLDQVKEGGAKKGGIVGNCDPLSRNRNGGCMDKNGKIISVFGQKGCNERTMPSYSADELADIVNHHVKLHGAGFFGDLWDGIKSGFSKVMGIAKPVLSMIPHPAAQAASKVIDGIGMGKPKRKSKKKGGAEVLPQDDVGGAVTAGAVTAGAKKKKGGASTGGAVTAGAVTGGSIKKSSDRKALIKEVMTKKGLTMIKASSYIKEHDLYIKKSK